MRRLLCITIVILFSFSLLASPIYTVETDRGIKAVVIPEDMTEREVLLELAKGYYNLSYQLEEYVEANEALITEVETYKREVQSYIDKNDQLVESYTDLVDDYKQINKQGIVRGLAGISTGLNFTDEISFKRISLDLGILIENKIGILGSIDFGLDKTIGMSIGLLTTF